MPEPVTASLSAPPPQHLTAPGAVHAPLLVPVPSRGPLGVTLTVVRPVGRATTPPLTLSEAKPLRLPHVTTPQKQPAVPAVTPPATAPVPPPPAPTPTPPATPPPVQEPPRVLTAVPPTPVATPTVSTPSDDTTQKGNGKGHAYGKAKHAKASKTDPAPPPAPVSVLATPESLTPVAQPETADLTPVDPSSPDTVTGSDTGDGDAEQVDHDHGHGYGRGNGKGHDKG